MRIQHLLLRCKALLGLDGSAAARRDAALLRGMSERELSDLGIGRSEIPALLACADAPVVEQAGVPVRHRAAAQRRFSASVPALATRCTA